MATVGPPYANLGPLQAEMLAHPVVQAALRGSGSYKDKQKRITRAVSQAGFQLPEGYEINPMGTGFTLAPKKGGFPWKLMAITGGAIAAPFAIGALTGGAAGAGAAGAGAGAAEAVLPSTALGTGAVTGLTELTPVVGSGIAGAVKKWFTNPENWMKLAGTATTLLGSSKAAGASERAAELQAKSAERAAELEAQTAREALAFQREQWGQTQANQAPWLRAGSASLDRLSGLMGLPGAPPAGLPPGVTRSPIAAPGAGTILMRSPTGQQQWVPSEQAAHYQQRGAQVVR